MKLTFIKILSDCSTPDSEIETVNLDTESVIFMKVLTQSGLEEEVGQQNGFCPPAIETDVSDAPSCMLQRDPLALVMSCPVGLHKGALLYPSYKRFYKKKKNRLFVFFHFFCSGCMFSLTYRIEMRFCRQHTVTSPCCHI